MGRSHLLAGAFVSVTVFLYVGCASGSKQQARVPGGAAAPAAGASESAPRPAEGQRAARGQVEPPTVGAAEAAPVTVAQHAESYAQNLEALLARRRAAPPPAADAGNGPAPAAPDPAPAGANAGAEVAPASPARPAAPPKAAAEEAAAETPVAPSSLALPTSRSLTQAPLPPAAPAAVAAAPAAVEPVAAPGPSARVAPPADALARQLATRAREYPRDAAAQLDFQLLQFLRDESVPDLAPLAALPAEDRELLTTLLDGLSNFRNGLRAEVNMLQSQKVSPLLEMGNRLRDQGELSLPTTALCTKVERFGVYEPMEPARFKAGVAGEAVLYCEVANFSSQLGDLGQWETRLKHECVLYSETGLAVWQDKADALTDRARNRRHDFYVVERLRLPPLPVGRYLLKVSVTDLQINRVAESTVPITVVAQ